MRDNPTIGKITESTIVVVEDPCPFPEDDVPVVS
jgi:hypothetical protein